MATIRWHDGGWVRGAVVLFVVVAASPTASGVSPEGRADLRLGLISSYDAVAFDDDVDILYATAPDVDLSHRRFRVEGDRWAEKQMPPLLRGVGPIEGSFPSVARQGNDTVALWMTTERGLQRTQITFSRLEERRTGTWSKPQDISVGVGRKGFPQVLCRPTICVAVWQQESEPGRNDFVIFGAALWGAGATAWSPPVAISEPTVGASADFPSVALVNDSLAFVAWTLQPNVTHTYLGMARWSPLTGDVEVASQIPRWADEHARLPALALVGGGIGLVWLYGGETHDIIVASRSEDGGRTWAPTVDLGLTSAGAQPLHATAFATSGQEIGVAWSDLRDGRRQILVGEGGRVAPVDGAASPEVASAQDFPTVVTAAGKEYVLFLEGQSAGRSLVVVGPGANLHVAMLREIPLPFSLHAVMLAWLAFAWRRRRHPDRLERAP